jgi:hypothetical protein
MQYRAAEVVGVSASKFTREIRGGLIERTAAGVSLADASRALDVRLATVKGWLTRGRREDSGDYADFAQAVDQARGAARSRPEPMDANELAEVVSQMARAGSVQAAKLRWEMLRSEAGEPGTAQPDEFDELKARRAHRAG